MLLWFAGLTFVSVAWIFASPAIDYRLVLAGSVLPVIEMVARGPWALHTLMAPVAAMTIVMLALRGKRLAQRRWLGIPIGLFMYLVLDGAWTRPTLFWWPLFGFSADDGDIPGWESPALLVGMEVVGLGALIWSARRYRLTNNVERRLFLSEGRLSRTLMSDPPRPR